MRRLSALFLVAVLFGAGCSPNQSGSENQATSLGSTVLDLHGHNLSAIPMDVFSRTDLVTLDVSNNRLTGAPPSQIGQLKNLQSLNLSKNALTGLPAELGQLTKLETLDVSDNKLTGLPMELGNLTQLRVLNVSGNPYSTQDLDAIAAKLPKTEIKR